MYDFEDMFNDMQDLVKRYSSGLINDEEFIEQRMLIIQQIKRDELGYYGWVLENKTSANSFMEKEYRKKVQELLMMR